MADIQWHEKGEIKESEAKILYGLSDQTNDAIENISEADISGAKARISGKMKAGHIVENTFYSEYKEFNVFGEALDFVINGTEIITYAKAIVVEEMALFRLMQEGKLMPLVCRGTKRLNPCEVCVNVNGRTSGNMVFYADFTHVLMPFSQFLVLPQKTV